MAVLAIGLLPAPAGAAEQSRCAEMFPDVDWVVQPTTGPTGLETAGLNQSTSDRFAAAVDRIAGLIESEIGYLDGSTVCLTSPELAGAFSEYVVPGQRLHGGVFTGEQLLVISAVEPRMIDDSIAFGLPQLALWRLSEDLGLENGYPDPLGTTIAHWYLARETGRLDRYRSELVIALFLDDPNPEERTAADAIDWVGDTKPYPSFFDPQFLGSQMGVFIEYAVEQDGTSVLRKTDQATWAALEKQWRIWIRDQYPRGSFGMWWGVVILVFFIALAIVFAWLTRRQRRRAAARRPTPPPDESLFTSPAVDS